MIAGKWLGMAGGAGLVAGLLVGWMLWRPKERVVETPAIAVRNTDNSLTLERRPDAAATPTHITPRGTLERIARLTVRPDPVIVHDTIRVPSENVARGTLPETTTTVRTDTVQAPDIAIELSLVRLPDRSRRVTASAIGGKVIGGIDIPVESAVPEKVLRWSAGPTYDPHARTYGAFLSRDLGPVRILLAADRSGSNNALTGRVGIGLRW